MIQALYDLPQINGKGTSDWMRQLLANVELYEDPDSKDAIKVEAEEAPTAKDVSELIDYLTNFKITRSITHAVGHCTATQSTATVTSIMNYWKNNLKWSAPGYAIIVGTNFYTVLATPNSVTNGASGYNGKGIHISYIGGIDLNGKAKDTMNDYQKAIFEVFFSTMKKKIPTIKCIGHNEVANKACPSFKLKDKFPNFWTGK